MVLTHELNRKKEHKWNFSASRACSLMGGTFALFHEQMESQELKEILSLKESDVLSTLVS
jgi:sulfur transfer protein SufE